MRKHLLIVLIAFIVLSHGLTAQTNLKNSAHFYIARSFHGTGDLSGICFTAEYGYFFNKKLEISGNITSTIHWGAFGLFVTNPFGTFDGSFRYGTAGLQAGSKLGYAILNLPKHILKLQGGSFVRFQSSSYPDMYAVIFPIATNYPEPVFNFRHNEKQNIVTLGYVAELSYAYTTAKRLMLGAKAGFQNDTNGDVISYYGIMIGKKLSFK